ncbi:hypothetical protein PRUPE_8G026400 [Prunus persica]|uniref:Cytochrome P450 n=1 Tax=Prunus persica TaxID=3760 RepID=M5VPG3_PRUPE|nr:hypothetical protein PRUPE_8G026400 [Prunus persica]
MVGSNSHTEADRSAGDPCPPYKLIHGNTKEISRMMKEAMARPKTISHDTLPLWHGSQAQLVITEPELCKEILNNKDGAYPKKEVQNFVKKLLGDGLVSTTEAEKWAKLRKLATLAFHGESLSFFHRKEIDVLQEFRLLSSEVTSRIAFGSSYIEGKNIFEMLTKLGFIIYKIFLTIRVPVIIEFFKTSNEIEPEKLEKGIQDSIIEIIKKREEKAMTGGEDRFGSDYLGLLEEAQHDGNDNQRILADEVVDDCKTFYMSGQETTTALLSWTVLLLAVHTDWQEEARKEMSMIINESLRLYPPPGQDVHLFKPERFSEGVAKATNNNIGALIPFGLGPRTCVGMNFGITEAKIALSMILQCYSFTLSPGYVHFPLHYLTVRPQHGVQVMLHSL